MGAESRLRGVARFVRPGDKAAPHDSGLTESPFHYNFVILSYLKDGEGAVTWKKKKNQCLSANKGSYAINVLLGSQLLPFSTALAWCPGVIYSAVTWWSLHHGRELNKNAIKEDKINLLTVLFNKNSWRMGRQAHKQCTSGWPGKEAGCSGFRHKSGAQLNTQ